MGVKEKVGLNPFHYVAWGIRELRGRQIKAREQVMLSPYYLLRDLQTILGSDNELIQARFFPRIRMPWSSGVYDGRWHKLSLDKSVNHLLYPHHDLPVVPEYVDGSITTYRSGKKIVHVEIGFNDGPASSTALRMPYNRMDIRL